MKNFTTGLFSKNLTQQILLLFLFIILFGVGALCLGQDIDGDLRNYHFYNGFAFLHQRMNYDIAPAVIQSYLNPFFDVINYLLISIQKPRVTGFLLGAVSGVTAFVVYQIAKILFAGLPKFILNLYALIAVVTGMTGAASVSLLGSTMNDDKVSLMIMTALYCMLRAITQPEKNAVKLIVIAALISGLAAGFKLPAACYAVGLFLAIYFSNLGNERNAYFCKVFIVACLAGFLIADGQWMYILYRKFQNPVYPFYNNIFHSSYAPFISFNISPARTDIHFWDYLILPVHLAAAKSTYAAELEMQDMRLALIFLMAAILFCRNAGVKSQQLTFKNSNANCCDLTPLHFLTVFFAVSYVVWLSLFAVYRYMLPLENISGLFIVYMTRNIFSTDKWRMIFLGLVIVMLGLSTHHPRWGRSDFHKEYFSMHVPAVPSNATVILTSGPYAYVVPFFPKSTQFIGMLLVQMGVDSNTKEQVITRKLYTDVMNKLKYEVQHGSVYTLGFQKIDGNNKKSLANLGNYGMVQDSDHCMNFETNIGDKLKLCPLATPVIARQRSA